MNPDYDKGKLDERRRIIKIIDDQLKEEKKCMAQDEYSEQLDEHEIGISLLEFLRQEIKK